MRLPASGSQKSLRQPSGAVEAAGPGPESMAQEMKCDKW